MYDEFMKIRNEFELPKDEFDLFKLSNYYNKKIKEHFGEDRVNKYIIWDYELMSCIEKNVLKESNKDRRLVSMFGWSNGYEWPDINNFKVNRNEFYDFCINNTENISMKIRYLDYLVDKGDNDKKYIYAQQLLDLLNSQCKITEDFLKFISYVSRFVDISVKFNLEEKMENVEKILIKKTEKIIEKENYRRIIKISPILHYLGFYKGNKRIQQNTIDKMIKNLEIVRDFYNEKDYHLYRSISWLLLEWYKAENFSEEDQDKILNEIGLSFEKQAENQEDNSNLNKSYFLEKAVQHYINIGKSHKIPEIKSKIKQAYREMINNDELHMISTELDIKKEELEKYTKRFKIDKIDESFKLLTRTSYHVPNLELIYEETKKIFEESVFSKFFNLSSIYDGRKIFQSVSEEDRFKHKLYQTYDMELKISFSIIFKDIWDYLISEGLTSDMVVKRITDWKYMNEQNKVIVEQGIEYFLDGDYIACLHTLVPQFETCFRRFFEYNGHATTSIKANTVQYEQNFNDFLRNDFVENNIDDNLLFFIKFVMVDDLGYNLRNNIAHGLINIGMLNFYFCSIVIYMFFMMTNFIWKTNEDKD